MGLRPIASTAAVLALACSVWTTDGAWTPLAPWTGPGGPNVLSLTLDEWRRPRHGEVEAIASLRLANGEEREVGRFVPTEQGDGRNLRVRLVLDRNLRGAVRGAPISVRVRLAPIHGTTHDAKLVLRSAKLEQVE